MEKAISYRKRLGAFLGAVAISWFIVWANWDTSRSRDLGVALTNPSFWLFWLGTAVSLTGFGYAFGVIKQRKDVGLAIFITGLCLVVNAIFLRDKGLMLLFGLVITAVGASYYWDLSKRFSELAQAR
jgi:hypothetical protein